MQGLGNKVYQFKNRVRSLFKTISWQLGIGKRTVLNARGNRILVYHGICQNDHLRYNTLFITQRSFEKQLQLYKKYCNIISLEDHYQQRFDNNKFNFCLTLDDGFANNYQYILPLLEKYEVPATFFITAIRDSGQDILWNDVLSIAYEHGPRQIKIGGEDLVKRKDGKYISAASGELLVDSLRKEGYDKKQEMIGILGEYKQKAHPDFWLQMKPEQIEEMAASKWVTIGSHGYYHNDLAALTAGKASEEMIRSKQWLENIIGKEVKAIAFPYGSYNSETVKKAKEAGYSQLLACEFLFPTDNSETTLRERFTINPFISPIGQLHANSSGKY